MGLCLSFFGTICLHGCIHPSCGLLDVTTCMTHLHDVGVLDTYLSPLCAMLLCLPCLLCATRLAFFASLHFYTLAYKFMYESVQTYICPARHPHFIWQHVCLPPFGTFRQLVFLACFPSTCFFTCLLACFFCHCWYTRGAWTHGARVCLPRHKQKKARMQAKGTSPQRAMFNRLGGLASLSGYIFLPLS